MLWLALERVRPVDVAPAGNALQCAEGGPITTGRDEQRLIDPQPAYVVREHLEGVVEHDVGELASVTHSKRPRGDRTPRGRWLGALLGVPP